MVKILAQRKGVETLNEFFINISNASFYSRLNMCFDQGSIRQRTQDSL